MSPITFKCEWTQSFTVAMTFVEVNIRIRHPNINGSWVGGFLRGSVWLLRV